MTILLAAVCSVTGREQDSPPGKSPESKTAAGAQKPARGKGKKLPGFTGEREAAAMTFVRTNHPELAELLEQLKSSDPGQYQRAIRDLFKSSERLAQLEERQPQRYPLELGLWKVNSRIQVLLARLTMSPEPAVEDQLRQAVAEQIDLRKQLLAVEQQRMEQRLAELKADRDDLEQHEQERIEQRMVKLLSEASRSRPLVKRKSQGKRATNDQPSGPRP
ncbi:MAG TPA: hypothetical protein VIK18_18785 [Pirellulales bacterium]